MIEPSENDCVYDEAGLPSIAAAFLLVALLFMVGCGPSNEDKKSTEAAKKTQADAAAKQQLLSDPDRAKAELIRRVRASVKMQDGLLIPSFLHGQVLEEVRIVNLFLADSVDARVYHALAQRCSLFEEFVGAMQPVLSRAMRMLLGREHFDETELATLAEQINNNPSLMEPFADDDEVDTHVVLGPSTRVDTTGKARISRMRV
jgi:hypothetical protein